MVGGFNISLLGVIGCAGAVGVGAEEESDVFRINLLDMAPRDHVGASCRAEETNGMVESQFNNNYCTLRIQETI